MTTEHNQFKSENQIIKEAIIKTIVFFDIFSYPLTAFELWTYSSVACSFTQFNNALAIIQNAGIASNGAYYFLHGRSEIIQIRNRRYNYSNRKMKRARKISKVFKFIPWIKMIAIGNVIGKNNLKDGSDIDFFIICEKNRVWISRFISTLITKFLFLRPRVNDVKDKICLSFYISEDRLELESLFIENKNDPYFVYWLANLVLIYDSGEMYKKLLEKNNWIKESLPNWQASDISLKRDIGAAPGYFYREIVDLFFGGLDPLLKKIQLKILPNDLRVAMNKNTRVVINNDILKLHVKDRRKAFLDNYKENLEKISLNY